MQMADLAAMQAVMEEGSATGAERVVVANAIWSGAGLVR
jgi:hypothetical protein